MLKQYIRHKRTGNPIGVMLSEVRNGNLEIGFSLCNNKDVYSKKKGEMIALSRLQSTEASIPRSLISTIEKFVDRSNRYFFKNAKTE